MPREYGRNRRVADLVQRELAVCIQREMSDTALKFITVSDVDVSPDLVNARVYVTSLARASYRAMAPQRRRRASSTSA